MSAGGIQSAERVSQRDVTDNYVFQRSLLAYCHAAGIVSGDVLEIGTGSGYGISVISPRAHRFVTLDKHPLSPVADHGRNVEFIQMAVPPMCGIPSCSFDFVIMFQVIEHIRDDFKMVKEIVRVLRPGGKLIISTPNRRMSLTRNPWHVREYTADEFKNLLRSYFSEVEAKGVFGNEKAMEYYEANKRSVAKISRLDLLKVQKWLPRPLLRIPYDIMNRINRRKLHSNNKELTEGITMDDYHIGPVNDYCFDLLYIAEK